MTRPEGPWAPVQQALALLAVDPLGLGGLVLRARVGPCREAVLAALPMLGLPRRRLYPSITDAELFGAMDVAETLANARPKFRTGLLSTPAALQLVMAERCPPDLAAKLALALDRPRQACLLALDEGADEDERLPPALADRLAFYVDLNGLRAPPAFAFDDPALARERLAQVALHKDAAATLTAVAARLGIHSLRAPILALRAARCAAALAGRDKTTSEDLETAASLVLAHRATVLPAPEQDQEPAPEEKTSASRSQESADEDLMIEAVRVALPEGLLPQSSGRSRGAAGIGAGEKQRAQLRGRPLTPKRRRPDGRSRVDLIATLRAAAPWQKLRRVPDRQVTVLPSDVHLKRYEIRSERLLIFLVDASGSAAHARLNEAKGAVEHLLARAYAHRDRVALIGFRNTGADVLMPPNKSLLLAKRRLSALPGGGATPLADGLQQGGELAWRAAKQGVTPTLILLTDGRANVALDGTQDRKRATEDAESVADWLRGAGIESIVLDTGVRPQKALVSLAQRMGAEHIALPRSNAAGLSRAIETATGR